MSDNAGNAAAAGGQPSGEPVDLSAVMRDEQLINALLADGEVPTSTDGEFEVVSLFSAARLSVLDAPIGFELSEEQISAALAQGSPASRPPTRRVLTSLVAGAASVAVVLGGLSIVANHTAETPSTGGGQSQQVVSASMIRADLDEVQELLDQGEVARGVELINSTTARMGRLDRTAEFDELNTIRVHLWARATGQPVAAAPAVGTTPTLPPRLPSQAAKPPAVKPDPTLPRIVLPPLTLPPLSSLKLPTIPAPAPPPPPPPPAETTAPPEPSPPATTTSPTPPPTPPAATTTSTKPPSTPASATTTASSSPQID